MRASLVNLENLNTAQQLFAAEDAIRDDARNFKPEHVRVVHGETCHYPYKNEHMKAGALKVVKAIRAKLDKLFPDEGE